jgi:cobalamin-dependent methionine synthase I
MVELSSQIRGQMPEIVKLTVRRGSREPLGLATLATAFGRHVRIQIDTVSRRFFGDVAPMKLSGLEPVSIGGVQFVNIGERTNVRLQGVCRMILNGEIQNKPWPWRIQQVERRADHRHQRDEAVLDIEPPWCGFEPDRQQADISRVPIMSTVPSGRDRGTGLRCIQGKGVNSIS